MLFGLAIEKSNIDANRVAWLRNGFFPDTNQKQGRRFVRRKSESGATCSACNLNVSQMPFILSYERAGIVKFRIYHTSG